jgi:HD-GYP domain-containing protein (c-di-GMP phosphodiesterase class II)
MATYIDLLRKHQKKSGKVEQHHEEDELALQDKTFPNSDLLTEDTTDPFVEKKNKTFPNSHLLTDETIEATVDTDAPLPTKAPSFANSKTTGTNEVQTSKWLTICTKRVAKLFKAARDDSVASIEPISTHLNVFLKKAAEKESTIIDALELEISRQIKQIGMLDPNLGSLIRKSIMMMLYAIKMGHQLKLNRDEIRSHTLAAMLHHIGMAQIPPEIRKKKKALTKKEQNVISTAPEKSHKYLMLCNIADTVILDAASQAQERYDGSGPQELSGSDIAYSARMIGLLSMFEALIYYRPYRHRLLPRDAIRHLVNHHKKAFDPIMLKALIESISLYPVGTYVQLNSGDVALVVRVHPLRPLRPQVLITHDSQGNEVSSREVDLQKQLSLTIERCMYKEQLSTLKESAEKESG